MLEEKAAPNDIKNLTTWSEKFVSKLASLWSKNGNVLHYFVHYIYSGSFICLAEWQKECKREGNCCPQRKIRQILLTVYIYTACTIHTPDRPTCITNILYVFTHTSDMHTCILHTGTHAYKHIMYTWCLNTSDMAKHPEDKYADSNFSNSCSGSKW